MSENSVNSVNSVICIPRHSVLPTVETEASITCHFNSLAYFRRFITTLPCLETVNSSCKLKLVEGDAKPRSSRSSRSELT